VPASAEEDAAATLELSEGERARIRAEMRYAALAVRETRPSEAPKGRLAKALDYLSNGFVLLIVGSLITSFLVPRFQRAGEARRQRAALMQEALEQFLLYSNSIWQEFYATLPLALEAEIAKEQYVEELNAISVIKLRRYDAYAKMQALALVFHGGEGDGDEKGVDSALYEYAVKVNAASEAIDRWLRNLYCTPTKRERSPCTTFDPRFDSYAEHVAIQKLVLEVGNESAQRVAGLMVRSIESVH
jgi:hypothetical protein